MAKLLTRSRYLRPKTIVHLALQKIYYINEVILAVSEVCSLKIRNFGQGRFHSAKLNICSYDTQI